MWYNGAGGDFLTHLLVVDDEVSILELIKNSLGKDEYLIYQPLHQIKHVLASKHWKLKVSSDESSS